MREILISAIRGTRAATAIEYALIASVIAVVIAIGTGVKGLFNSVASAY